MTLDEIYSVKLSENSIMGIVNGLKTDAHPPLYFIILHFWEHYFGNQAYSVRGLSILFGVIGIFLGIKISSLILGPSTGLWAGLLFAVSPFFIQYSQQTRGYSLFLCLVLFSYFFFIKFSFQEEKIRKNLIGYIIFTVAMLYTHVYGCFVFLAQLTHLLIFTLRKEESWKKWVFPVSVITLLFCLWLPVVYHQVFNVREHWSPKLSASWDSVVSTLLAWGGNWIIVSLLFAVIVKGIWGVKGELFRKSMLLGTWCLVSIIPPMVISLIKPMYFHRYSVGAAAAFYILAAQGMSKFRLPWVIPLTAVVLVVSYVPFMNTYYMEVQKENWRGMVQFVEDHELEEDVIFTFPAKSVIPVRYYYNGTAPVYGINPKGYLYKINLKPYGVTDEVDLPEFPQFLLSELVNDKKRIWLILRSEVLSYNLNEVISDSLGTPSLLVEKKFRGGKIFLFEIKEKEN